MLIFLFYALKLIGSCLRSSPTFADDDDDALKAKIRSGETAPIPGHYSPELDQVLNAMLTVDVSTRSLAQFFLPSDTALSLCSQDFVPLQKSYCHYLDSSWVTLSPSCTSSKLYRLDECRIPG